MVWPFTQKPPAAKSASYSLDSPALMNLMMRGEATSLNAVGPDTAMRLSTVYACIKVLSETVSTLPCHLFKLSDDRATKSHAWGDALHSLVNRSPNDWQTSQEFWQQQMVNLCLRGNSYNYIVRAGSSGRSGSGSAAPALAAAAPPL